MDPEGSSSSRSTSPIKKPRSTAWAHFTATKDEKKACNYCKQVFESSTGTSSLLKHLRKKHPAHLPVEFQSTVDDMLLTPLAGADTSALSFNVWLFVY
jgi:hypothetical protein